MLLEKGIQKELLKTAYWLKASDQHIYAITLEYSYYDSCDDSKELCGVKAVANELDHNYIDSDVDWENINNGDEVMAFSLFDDWFLEIDIMGKYYFPKFNEDKNQWYHKEHENEVDYMDDFSFLLKETYKIAMKVSGLQTF